jgi:hypothetical protein
MRPGEGPRDAVAAGQPQPDPAALRVRAFNLDQGPAGGRQQGGHPAEQDDGQPADADVPVGEQHGVPPAGPRHVAEDRAAVHAGAGGPGEA